MGGSLSNKKNSEGGTRRAELGGRESTRSLDVIVDSRIAGGARQECPPAIKYTFYTESRSRFTQSLKVDR